MNTKHTRSEPGLWLSLFIRVIRAIRGSYTGSWHRHRRANHHIFELEPLAQFANELHGLRVVSVDADRRRGNVHVGSIHGANFSFRQHSDYPISGFDRVVDERPRIPPRNKRSVRQIISISENLGRRRKPKLGGRKIELASG